MSGPAAIDISELVANAKLGKQHVAILLLSAMMLFIDGFDLGTVNVAAPAILRAFHAEKRQMGVVLGAGFLGILIGCWLYGYVGDRWGRKIGSIWACLCYTLPAFMITQAGSLEQIMIWRFLAGIGLGGVMPTTLALLAESAPKRYRASFAMLALFGFLAGTALIGLIAARFIPEFGWSAVFYAGGIAGAVLTVILIFCLPESIQWLALHKPEAPVLRRQTQRLMAGTILAPDTRLFVPQQEQPKGLVLVELFKGRQRLATVLLWVAYFAESMTYITFASWLAVLLETAGLSPVQASITFSYAGGGGIVVALALMRPLDKIGPMASVVTALVAIAAMITLGTPGLPQWLIMASAICAHSFCSATHASLNGTVGLFYPTRIRSNGVGWASAMGRIASMIGPVVVGYLLSAKLPLQDLLYFLAMPYFVLVLTCIGLGRLYQRNYRPASETTTTLEPAPAAE
ncbi:MAG TPA: MFS transporter [Stellaceae bacterium]|nr:MFS transporter [Stellaceae bacterium]